MDIEIQSEDPNITNYNFSLSDDSKLIAFWIDNIAMDKFTGVEAKIVLLDSPFSSIIGIDVLEGIQQLLVIIEKNSILIIEDLIVRDYPIILYIK